MLRSLTRCVNPPFDDWEFSQICAIGNIRKDFVVAALVPEVRRVFPNLPVVISPTFMVGLSDIMLVNPAVRAIEIAKLSSFTELAQT